MAPFVIEVIRGTSMPIKDSSYSVYAMTHGGGSSDPLVVATLFSDKTGKLVGQPRRSLTKLATTEPVWRFFADFDLPAEDHGVTHVLLDVFDYDLDAKGSSSEEWMCCCKIALSDLTAIGALFASTTQAEGRYQMARPSETPLMDMDKDPTGKTGYPMLEVRLVPSAGMSNELTLFMIRHGESEWNDAQKHHNFIAQLKQVNHPLDGSGVDQCRLLNAQYKEALASMTEPPDASCQHIHDFQNADIVYASPLTRATQTCMVGLSGHPTMARGVTLLSAARETKSVGGQDTVGDSVGPAVLEGATAGLAKYLDKITLADVVDGFGPVDHFDAVSKWWTEWNDADNSTDMDNRYANFLSTVRYNGTAIAGARAPRVVVVGHSHFIRHFCQKYFPASLAASDPTADRLCKENLGNACCIMVKMAFGEAAVPAAPAGGPVAAKAAAVKGLFDLHFKGESQAQVSKCAHSGCLRKQGGVRKNWLKRWFVADDLLHPKLIFYYDSGGKKLGKMKGEINLEGCEGVRVSQAPNADPLEIEVLTTARTYRLIADSPQNQQEWIAVLSHGAGLLPD